MFFVIPEMPSKTFVMLYKKLPDHFKNLKYYDRLLTSEDMLDQMTEPLLPMYSIQAQQLEHISHCQTWVWVERTSLNLKVNLNVWIIYRLQSRHIRGEREILEKDIYGKKVRYSHEVRQRQVNLSFCSLRIFFFKQETRILNIIQV